MTTIDINELLDYTICSYKYNFPVKKRQLDSFWQVKSHIYSKIFDYCLYLKSCDQEITIYKLNQELNYIWNDIKQKVVCSLSISDKIAIKNKLFKFVDLFSTVTTVMYYAIPVQLSVSNTNILFDLYSFYQEGKIKSLAKVNTHHLCMFEDSYSIQIAGAVVQNGIKTLLDSIKHNVYIFRTDTVDLYKYIYRSKIETTNIINSIVKGIENKLHVPKNDYITCNSCVHRLDCSWSLSNNE